MTIGEGIFWSTVIIVAFASIVLLTKYKRWRAFFKVLAVIVAVGAALGISGWLYYQYDNRPQIVTTLNGISLGMSEVDVTLQKGKPDQVSELDPIEDGYRKFLLYKGFSDAYTYTILRGQKESMVVTDICDKGGYGRVLGFGEYSSEEDVVEKLGKPSNVSVNEKGTEKILSYQKWNAAFEVAQGAVTKVCVTNQPAMRYSIEYGEPSEPAGQE